MTQTDCSIEGALLRRLLDRLEAAEVDAERYRWLRSGSVRRQEKGVSDRGARQISKSETQCLMTFSFWCSLEELDAAIDAARSGK